MAALIGSVVGRVVLLPLRLTTGLLCVLRLTGRQFRGPRLLPVGGIDDVAAQNVLSALREHGHHQVRSTACYQYNTSITCSPPLSGCARCSWPRLPRTASTALACTSSPTCAFGKHACLPAASARSCSSTKAPCALPSSCCPSSDDPPAAPVARLHKSTPESPRCASSTPRCSRDWPPCTSQPPRLPWGGMTWWPRSVPSRAASGTAKRRRLPGTSCWPCSNGRSRSHRPCPR